MKNQAEYFAELSTAFFSTNIFYGRYYPYDRKDLLSFDPLGYEMIKSSY